MKNKPSCVSLLQVNKEEIDVCSVPREYSLSLLPILLALKQYAPSTYKKVLPIRSQKCFMNGTLPRFPI
jgi:hypothetical protein